jgi:hypothetical protein
MFSCSQAVQNLLQAVVNITRTVFQSQLISLVEGLVGETLVSVVVVALKLAKIVIH